MQYREMGQKYQNENYKRRTRWMENPHLTARHQTDWNFLAPESSDLKNVNNYDQNPPKFQPDLRDNNDHVDHEDDDEGNDDVLDLAD